MKDVDRMSTKQHEGMK